jgi:release factor H-coupled RctB family protein
MGNPFGDKIPHDATARGGAISRFHSPSAWIEGEAFRQLDEVAARPGMIELKAFPDLHPGKYGPVGMVALADRLYPQLIGNDIGCGMSLFELDLPLRKFKLERAADQLRKLEEVEPDDPAERLETLGMAGDYFAGALGTIGGGCICSSIPVPGRWVPASSPMSSPAMVRWPKGWRSAPMRRSTTCSTTTRLSPGRA